MQAPFISLNSEQLDRALLQSLEVTQRLNDHWTCRMVLRDTPDRRPPVEDFAGKPLKITTTDFLGIETVVFQGFVQRMQLTFEITGAWGAELDAVSPTWKMAQGKRLRYFRQQTAQAAAQTVAAAAGVPVAGNMPTGATLSYVQWDETDFSFVARLVDDTEAWFRPSVSGSDGIDVETAFQSGTSVTWREGEYGLLEWTTQGRMRPVTASGANYDPLVMTSEVTGNISSTLSFYGDAASAMVAAAQGASGAVESAWVDRHRAATLEDLHVRLERESRRGVANTVVCHGVSRNPAVRAGDTLAVTGLPGVDATYGVVDVLHQWTTQGYENHFSATPAQRWSPPVRPPRPLLDGVFPARVVDNHDPHNQARIRVKYYWQQDSETTWVRLLSLHAGAGRGMLFLPEVGDEVLITFEDGDAERPCIVGSAWNGVQQPPATGFHQPGETNGSEFAGNNIKRIVTRAGHRVTLVDTPGKETISLATPRSNHLMLTEAHADTGGRPALVLQSTGDIILAAPNGRIHAQSLLQSREVGSTGAASLLGGGAPALRVLHDGRFAGQPGPCVGQGMDNDADRAQFEARMKQLQKDWPTLTPDKRAQRLVANGNEQTAKQGVPPMGVKTQPMRANGEFNSSSWQMAVNSDTVNKPALSDQDTADLSDTVYHESRHSETTYAAARNEAAISKDEQAQDKTIPINAGVNKQAMQHPLKPGSPGWACAEAVKQSTFGAGKAARNKTMTDLGKDADERDRAQKESLDALKNHADDGTQKRLSDAAVAAQQKYDNTYKDYRALPGEADAWSVGDKVGSAMDTPLPKQ